MQQLSLLDLQPQPAPVAQPIPQQVQPTPEPQQCDLIACGARVVGLPQDHYGKQFVPYGGRCGVVVRVGQSLGVAVAWVHFSDIGPPFPVALDYLQLVNQQPAIGRLAAEWRWWPNNNRWSLIRHALTDWLRDNLMYPDSAMFAADADPNQLGIRPPQ